MPTPTSSLATLRPDLAASFEEYDVEASHQGFIAHRVFPKFEVDRAAGVFGRIPIEALLANRETRRSPGGAYARDDWEFTPDSFATVEHGAEEPVDDNEAETYRDYFVAEQVAAIRAMDAVLRNAERRVADALFNATTYASQKTGVSNEWDDATNATPIDDVDAACEAVWSQCGLWPNCVVMNKHVFRNVRKCDQIIDLMKYQSKQDVRASQITPAALAAVFDVDMVLVGDGAKNTAAKGQAISIGKIWSDEYVSVCRVATSDDIREACVGRTFFWPGDGAPFDGRVEEYREERVRGNVIRYRHQVQEKALHTEAAHLLENITT